MYEVLSEDMALKTASRWEAIYVLLGIYAFWMLLYIIILKLRTLGGQSQSQQQGRIPGASHRQPDPQPGSCTTSGTGKEFYITCLVAVQNILSLEAF